MPSAAEVKGRIKSIERHQKDHQCHVPHRLDQTAQGKERSGKTRPYFYALRNEIKRIFRTVRDVESQYFYPPGDEPITEGTFGCLVITADKGLAGSYNQNVIKKAMSLLEKHSDTQLFVVGEYGRHFLTSIISPLNIHFCIQRRIPPWTGPGR